MADIRFNLENTRFIYATNLSGDPAQDRFADTRRKCNILIPSERQAQELKDMGIRVRETRPSQDDDPDEFVPEHFVTAILKYRDRTGRYLKYPPKVYLVSGDAQPVLLDEADVGMLDGMRISNVDVVLNAYEYDPVEHKTSLYIRTMYVQQDTEDDPYASKYANRGQFGYDPF